MKKSNYSNSYLEFLKKKKAMSKVKNPIDNIVSQNVELMGNISPQNIPDIDKPSNQIGVKSIENPKIDIKMPKSVESKSDKNIKKVYVEEKLDKPKFSFDRSSKKDIPKKKNKKKSEMKKSKKKKTKRKSRKVSFTVNKPKKSECDRFKKVNEDIDKKDDAEVDSILKGKGIKTTGKNRKLKRDLLKCMDDKISVKKE
tara:strand:- start:2052 stop:2645 length:594 start_codon:yes stop_codon:yes gene_type:complete